MHDTDLVIVHPGAQHAIYGDLARDVTAIEPPAWARMLAGYVRDRGYSVRIVDAEALGLSPAHAAATALYYAPSLICIACYGHQPSASTQQMSGGGETAKEIKLVSDTPIIMVGGHVAVLTERTLREERIDYACNGEGPETLVGLLEKKAPSEIPGLVWRRKSAVIENPVAPLVSIDQLQGDTWDLLPMGVYRAHNWHCYGGLDRQPYASIYTTLGCPFKCSFCCINAPFQSNRYRMRSPKSVVDEIVMLYHKYGVKNLKIADEMFVLNERHYLGICNGLIESGIAGDLNIWAYARVDTVKPETLATLRKAGIRWLGLGIESGSKYVRDGADKRLRNDDIVSVVRSIQAAGIHVIGNYIFGLRDDDMQSMQATLDLAMECNAEFANIYSAMAYPGSQLYTEAVEKGWRLPPTWRAFSQHNPDCFPLDTEHVDNRTVLRFRDEAFTAYFTNPAYLDMVARKFGQETVSDVKRMASYRLERNLLDGLRDQAAQI